MKIDKTFESSVTLLVMNHRGDRRDHILEPNRGVFVGKSSNCGLQLNDTSLADIHCRIELSQGKLHLQRWPSADAVLLNQKAVESCCELDVNDVIGVGSYEIRILQGTPSSDHITKARSGEDGSSNVICSGQPSLLPASPPASLEKLQRYLDELTQSDGEALSEGSETVASKSFSNPLDTKTESNIDNPNNEQGILPTESSDDHPSISHLRSEIQKLQFQLNDTVRRNDQLQKRLLELSERKVDLPFDGPDRRQPRPANFEEKSSPTESPKTYVNQHEHTSRRAKTLTTKRLSTLTKTTDHAKPPRTTGQGFSEEKINTLRTELRDEYQSNRDATSILSRFSQLWK
ncbi:MAG: FHA domain-containing protein [Planctomycetota bacterium]|nr:FHA domain-containing protein [Planctomycetota bacterium]